MRGVLVAVLVLAWLGLAQAASPAGGPPGPAPLPGLLKLGQEFPDVSLEAPDNPSVVAYLGLDPRAKRFTVADVRAEFVLLEILNAFCIHCNAEAPAMNELQAAIQEAGLAARLKMLGVGANNTPFELKLFRDRHKVAFPLVPDPKMEFALPLGVTSTPTFFLLAMSGPRPRVIHVQEGRSNGAQEFLKLIRQKAGI